MKASVVILNWNGGAENCIEAVSSAIAQDYANKEIIFVDNASSDGSYEAVRNLWPDLVYVQNGENLGCPGGRNAGARAATGDLIFFLENDGSWPQKNLISTAVAIFSENPSIGALYTSVEGYESGITDPPIDRAPIPDDPQGLYLSSSFRGGASIIRSDLFIRIGMFPEDFFRQHEEVMVSLLIYDAGFDIVYCPGLRMRHKGSDYPGKSESVVAYNIINDLKIVARCYPRYVWPPIFALKLANSLIRIANSSHRHLIPNLVMSVLRTSFRKPGSHRISLSVLNRNMRLRRGLTPTPYADHTGHADQNAMTRNAKESSTYQHRLPN